VNPDLTVERRQAHALLDMLPAEKLNAIRSLLEVMVEPLTRSLALAPVEEDEISSERLRHWIEPVLHWPMAKASHTRRSFASSA
jgi:hypothetical protein